MEEISWTDCMRNEEALERREEYPADNKKNSR